MKIIENHDNSVLDYFRCTFTKIVNISLVLKRFCEMHNFSDVGFSANCDTSVATPQKPVGRQITMVFHCM